MHVDILLLAMLTGVIPQQHDQKQVNVTNSITYSAAATAGVFIITWRNAARRQRFDRSTEEEEGSSQRKWRHQLALNSTCHMCWFSDVLVESVTFLRRWSSEPHVNIIILRRKVVFQLPFFCETLSVHRKQEQNKLKYYHLTWMIIIVDHVTSVVYPS